MDRMAYRCFSIGWSQAMCHPYPVEEPWIQCSIGTSFGVNFWVNCLEKLPGNSPVTDKSGIKDKPLISWFGQWWGQYRRSSSFREWGVFSRAGAIGKRSVLCGLQRSHTAITFSAVSQEIEIPICYPPVPWYWGSISMCLQQTHPCDRAHGRALDAPPLIHLRIPSNMARLVLSHTTRNNFASDANVWRRHLRLLANRGLYPSIQSWTQRKVKDFTDYLLSIRRSSKVTHWSSLIGKLGLTL
jgi:hypothetical protein